MKNEHPFKSFGALSFDGKAVGGPPAPAPSAAAARSAPEGVLAEGTTMSDEFREMLYQRYTAPYPFASAYRHWGINE